jgi:hypothetical protein
LYLIEKEIFENGLRDLSKFIPRVRTKDYFKGLVNVKDNFRYIEKVQEEVEEVSITNDLEVNVDEGLSDDKVNVEVSDKVSNESKDNDEDGLDIDTSQDLSCYGV